MTAESPFDRRWKTPVLPFIIGKAPEPLDQKSVAALSECYVPDISDVIGRMYTASGISSIYQPAKSVVGTAFTVKCPPGDNLALKKALQLTRPGDVIVVDAQGFTDWCLGGFQMLQLAIQERGLRGLVVHGAYRDPSEAQANGFPLYASAISSWSGPKIGPGEINVPVCCGGVIVQPGDAVCASGDGVVIIPRAFVTAVISRLAENKRKSQSRADPLSSLREQDVAHDAYVSAMAKFNLLDAD